MKNKKTKNTRIIFYDVGGRILLVKYFKKALLENTFILKIETEKESLKYRKL